MNWQRFGESLGTRPDRSGYTCTDKVFHLFLSVCRDIPSVAQTSQSGWDHCPGRSAMRLIMHRVGREPITSIIATDMGRDRRRLTRGTTTLRKVTSLSLPL
jgi:hypothetical protein